MLSFESDYTEGAHPAILEKFIETISCMSSPSNF